MRPLAAILALPLALALVPREAPACTNFVVTRGASTDGSVMITYSADSHGLYGELYYTPPGVHPEGSTIEVFEWDTGRHLGRIPQAARTYAVVGNMNEHQVSIGETTFGGRKELLDAEGTVDYGSLMYLALQRSRTAREAVDTIGALAEAHGYASEGETFSIADPREAWLMEMVGKGPKGKGAVWVALRVPDGHVTAHANASRIRKFPLRDPKICVYSKDVIGFAREKKWFDGKDEDFSFADAYNPASFGAQRFCEARVWAFYRRVSAAFRDPTPYVRGVEGAEPLPLWIKPDKPLSARDVAELMRDHFEGTEFDLGKGVGAGPYGLPYRWRPLTWEHEGAKYLNERATSTQQTGFSFVAQMRPSLPDPIGGVLWFGVDDTFLTVYVPMYAGIREAPYNFRVGTGDFRHFTWDSAWWVFNVVANWTYARWSDIVGDVRSVQRELEGEHHALLADADATAVKLWAASPEQARAFLTDFSARRAAKTVERWRKLSQDLFVKYLDGNTRDEMGKVKHPGYSKEWKQRVVNDEGARLKVTKFKTEPAEE
ncbi:MAG: C69 family dipeptidase [Deltaproteobacteria bacterium]|nr:C69 family dipeptidase [Deltaproteobacteria bacterium]